jgi:hypothetical protein
MYRKKPKILDLVYNCILRFNSSLERLQTAKCLCQSNNNNNDNNNNKIIIIIIIIIIVLE